MRKFIYIVKNGFIKPLSCRQKIGRVFLLEDGVYIKDAWIDNDTIHFSTYAKAKFARDKR